MTLHENKKEKIVAIATALFNRLNYDAVSMSTIAAKVGITKAALYYHFQSKHDLFYHCINTTTDAFIMKIQAILSNDSDSLETQLTALNYIHIEFILKNHGFMNYFHKSESHHTDSIFELIMQKRQAVVLLAEPLLQKIIDKKHLTNIITPQDLSASILGMTKGLLCEAHQEHTKEEKEILAKKITSLILA